MSSATAMNEPFNTRMEARLLVSLLGRIALIVFLVEAVVMVMLSGWQLTPEVLSEGLLDATALTLFASPMIYLWAAKPFAVAAHDAQAALSRELEARARQSLHLEATLAEFKDLLNQNEQLRARLQQSSVEFSTVNERTLQRIGSDLHDGPAQLLSFALMRLHRFMPSAGAGAAAAALHEDIARVRGSLQDALREVRSISGGLALPELEQLSLEETIYLSIGAHEDRTDTSVTFDIGELPVLVSHPMKVCAYRLVQEALTNAVRHAGGIGQRVEARTEGDEVLIIVSDSGPGMEDAATVWRRGLGLPGLRSRVEAIGGTFELRSWPGTGTTVAARFARGSLGTTGRTDV